MVPFLVIKVVDKQLYGSIRLVKSAPSDVTSTLFLISALLVVPKAPTVHDLYSDSKIDIDMIFLLVKSTPRAFL